LPLGDEAVTDEDQAVISGENAEEDERETDTEG
jgi:hypothetical protein